MMTLIRLADAAFVVLPCGWIIAMLKRCALALLLAIAAGCATVTSERDPTARLPEMQQVLHEARRTASGIQDEEFKGLALSVIALWQVEAKDVSAALETAAAIPDAARESSKAPTLAGIALGQMKTGDHSGASRTFQRARQAAAAIEDAFFKATALREIAKQQAKAGDVSGALETSATIEDASYKATALREIAEEQAKAGDVRGALETAATIEDASDKASALLEIAAAQAKVGDSESAARTFDQALEAARAIANNLDRAIAVALIAADRAEAGNVQGALAWAATLSGDPVAKVSVLVGVATGVLQPTRRLGEESKFSEARKRLLPRWSHF